MKHCKNLLIMLSDDKDYKMQDIDGVDLFQELKTSQCLVKPGIFPQDVLNDIYSKYLK